MDNLIMSGKKSEKDRVTIDSSCGYITLNFLRKKDELGNYYEEVEQLYTNRFGKIYHLFDETPPPLLRAFPSKQDEKQMLRELSKCEETRATIFSLLKDGKDDRIKMFLPKRETKKGQINDEMIEIAKGKPITDMMEFDRSDKALCCWHSDTQPSMKYYEKTNTVYCFACGKGGDSISIYRELNNCDFKTAVLDLS